MAYSKARQRATAKYMRANYDEIKIRVAKGQKEIIQQAAAKAGQSTNQYILQAVQDRLTAEQQPTPPAERTPGTPEQQ